VFEIKDLKKPEAVELLNMPVPDAVREYYNMPYKANREQIEQYQTNGFIKIPRVLEGEALTYSRRIIGAALLLRKESDKRTLTEKSQYEQSFLQCGYLCWDYEPVREFVFGKRFAGLARDLMMVESIRLWHDQALYKEPGGRITDMHQDISYWPIDTPNSITLWLALVDVPVDKGNLYFIPGSHNFGMDEYVDIFKDPHVPDHLKNSEQIDSPLIAGDATFHSGKTYHGARGNRSTEMREAMTVIYIENGTRFDTSDARNATHTSCKGLKDGDIINTKYTPILIKPDGSDS
jgi:hypothetical protein